MKRNGIQQSQEISIAGHQNMDRTLNCRQINAHIEAWLAKNEANYIPRSWAEKIKSECKIRNAK